MTLNRLDPSLSLSPDVETTLPDFPRSLLERHLAAIRQAQTGNLSNWAAIDELPRRKRPIESRLLAQAISRQLFPDYTPVKAIIAYDAIVKGLKHSVSEEKQKAVIPATNKKAQLLIPQGPWKGQELDPVPLDGPPALPMPIAIPPKEEFAPVFSFLRNGEDPNPYIKGISAMTGVKPGKELVWQTPMIEFERGIIYDDGRLDLCKMGTGPTHITDLMDSLEDNQFISQFLLGNNVISGTGADRIAKFIAEHPDRMETWYLAGGHINITGLRKLVSAMVLSKKITNVWLKRNPLGPTAPDVLADLVLHTENLRTLDVENTALGDEGLSRFFDVLSASDTPHALRNIYLNANGMGCKGAVALAKYLDSPHTQIESLFLGSNPLGEAGIALLAPSLARHTFLQRLALTSTGLNPSAVNILCKALTNHPSFTTIDIGTGLTTIPHGQRYNWVTGASIPSLCEFIQSPGLRFVSLGHVWLGQSAMSLLEAAVCTSNLVRFDVFPVIVPGADGKDDLEDFVVEAQAGRPSFIRNFCFLGIHRQLEANVTKFYPNVAGGYQGFLKSMEFRSLRNTSDVRLIDSHYRTKAKRENEPMDQYWEEGDEVWKMVLEDSKRYE